MISADSWGDDSATLEVNHCHGPGRGHPCTDGRGTRDVKDRSTSYARPAVIRVSSIDEAVRLIQQGKVVELPTTRSVNTLLEKMALMARVALAKGEDAPIFDLCKVTVRGTNLFCSSRVRTDEHPQGVPRIAMPQFKGTAETGTEADALPKNKRGRVDGSDAFVAHMQSLGIATSKDTVPASRLKASQSELIGSKVAELMTSKDFDPHHGRIFISRDNYVIDGHHRWAAVVGLDAADNKLGNITMKTIRVDAPISEVLQLARAWTKRFGIRSQGV